ncbi:MAG: hypothetical protein GX638_03730 [Crenarchaeota archaeon]|nr:hypothetical protein [Thermoproteota archaeon]
MSMNITPVFQTAFDAEVKVAYGQAGSLRETVKVKSGVIGKEVYFRKVGKAIANLHIRGNNRITNNMEFSQVLCPLADYDVFDYVDKLDMKKINFSEIKEVAQGTGRAAGLKIDQLIIDALVNGYDDTDMEVGTSGAALTVATLTAAKKKLDDNGVPNMDRHFLHDGQQMQDLLADTTLTSSEYNTVKALVNGEINTYVGFKFHHIATNRVEGGLPSTNSGVDRLAIAYHKEAVGLALGQDIESEMEYMVEKGGWLVGCSFSAGAVVIDNEGVVGVISRISDES